MGAYWSLLGRAAVTAAVSQRENSLHSMQHLRFVPHRPVARSPQAKEPPAIKRAAGCIAEGEPSEAGLVAAWCEFPRQACLSP